MSAYGEALEELKGLLQGQRKASVVVPRRILVMLVQNAPKVAARPGFSRITEDRPLCHDKKMFKLKLSPGRWRSAGLHTDLVWQCPVCLRVEPREESA